MTNDNSPQTTNTMLNEKTPVPLNWLFVLLSGAIGSISVAVMLTLYFSSISATADDALSKAKEARQENKDASVIMQSIDSRLSRIEGALKIKKD